MKILRVVLRWCGAHWYALAWIVLAAYCSIYLVFRPSDDGIFMMIIAPIGACAFMIAFFSPVFKEDSDAPAHRPLRTVQRAAAHRAVNRPTVPDRAVRPSSSLRTGT
jgi:hypothetical protein